MSESPRNPSLIQSLIPIFFLIGLLIINVIFVFGDDSLLGANQMALLFAGSLAAMIGGRLGFNWKHIVDGIVKSISSAMSALLILLLIGALSGTWLISGVVPAMIYYGLDILNPTIFLFAACFVSAIVSLATGSSWSTAATIGIALVGIGKVLGIEVGLVAGAVISGAYFGDKMSPLSDTTNLAPAMAGTDLFTHIKYMALTTGPSILITLAIFLIWGFTFDSDMAITAIDPIQTAIASKFHISGWLFIVPLVVILLIVKKVPALPALFAGTILGAVFALIFQPEIVNEVSGMATGGWVDKYAGIMRSMYASLSVVTGNPTVDELLASKGMVGMLNTIWLIICAMIFGGVMECTGMLKRLATEVIKLAHSTGSLVLSTAATCFGFNLTASDQYLAIVVPGRMFASTYRDRGLAPENLSRTLEDTGTVTSVLVPWNTCGAYQSGVLGVATGEYFMYCFFNIISPFMTVMYAYLGIKIRKLSGKSEENV